MRQVMPSRLRHRIDALQVTAVGQPTTGPDTPVDSTVLTAIGAAVHAHEVLRFDYASTSAATARDRPAAWSPTTSSPGRGAGISSPGTSTGTTGEPSAVDRVSPRTPTGPRFTPRQLPMGDVATYVTGRFRGSTDTSAWPCVGEVILDLPAAVVATYTRDGLVEELGPDRCRLVQGSWSWVGLAAALGRFDADIEVIGPAELKAAFAGLARRYADAAG